jgi:nitrate/nitrite-specific signal transduction histidine kinase
MKQRAKFLGGDLELTGGPEKGCSVVLTITNLKTT